MGKSADEVTPVPLVAGVNAGFEEDAVSEETDSDVVSADVASAAVEAVSVLTGGTEVAVWSECEAGLVWEEGFFARVGEEEPEDDKAPATVSERISASPEYASGGKAIRTSFRQKKKRHPEATPMTNTTNNRR